MKYLHKNGLPMKMAQEVTSPQSELGLALRDHVLDRLFAKRNRTLEEISPELSGETDSEAALAAALGDELDWLL